MQMELQDTNKSNIISKLEKMLKSQYRRTQRNGVYGYFQFSNFEKIYFNYYDGLYKVTIEY